MQRILDGALDGLVKLWERPVGKSLEWTEQSADSLGIHDERTHMILRMGVRLEVRYVNSHPLLSPFVPPDLFAVCIPGLALQIARSAVVHNPSICRPRKGPVRINSQ